MDLVPVGRPITQVYVKFTPRDSDEEQWNEGREFLYNELF